MNTGRYLIIVNPASGGGRTGHLLEALQNAVQAQCGTNAAVLATEGPGHATVLARQQVLEGYRKVVIVGGDGTIHECVNGICDLPRSYTEDVAIAIISTGTGCGLARSLGIPPGFEDQISVAFGPDIRTIDLGRLEFDNTEETRFFVNECQIGIGAEVVRRTKRGKKALGGSLAYTLATIPLLFTYPNPEIKLQWDDSIPQEVPVTGISIGNGAITAGGMHLTPHAILDDGLLDVLVMKGQSSYQRARSFLHVRSGRHVNSSHFDYHQICRIHLSSPLELPISADGELVGNLPVTIDTYRSALHVHAPSQNRRSIRHDDIHATTEAVRI
jgi:diacylglycerol kinase (ATP)